MSNHPMLSTSTSSGPKVEKVVTPVRVAPKIILKNSRDTLTKRDCELIRDCVEAIADQDCVGEHSKQV
jgi:hypothetical protein